MSYHEPERGPATKAKEARESLPYVVLTNTVITLLFHGALAPSITDDSYFGGVRTHV